MSASALMVGLRGPDESKTAPDGRENSKCHARHGALDLPHLVPATRRLAPLPRILGSSAKKAVLDRRLRRGILSSKRL
jgi:hypothetical protein